MEGKRRGTYRESRPLLLLDAGRIPLFFFDRRRGGTIGALPLFPFLVFFQLARHRGVLSSPPLAGRRRGVLHHQGAASLPPPPFSLRNLGDFERPPCHFLSPFLFFFQRRGGLVERAAASRSPPFPFFFSFRRAVLRGMMIALVFFPLLLFPFRPNQARVFPFP